MKKIPEYLTAQEIKKLFETIKDNRDTIMIKLTYSCGLRNAEVCNLQVNDFNFEEKTLTLKNNKTQILPYLSYELILLLQKYISYHELKSEDKLFDISTRGFSANVKKYGKRAGIEKDIHPHMLRHSFAIHSLKAGVSLRSIQKMLGHSSLTTTQIYLDILVSDIRDDVRKHPLPV